MSPETVIIAASVVCAGLVLVMVRLTRHFAAPQPISVTAEWLDQLSIETTDLLRLLDKERLQLLPTNPDFTARMPTKLHIQRCQLLHETARASAAPEKRFQTRKHGGQGYHGAVGA